MSVIIERLTKIDFKDMSRTNSNAYQVFKKIQNSKYLEIQAAVLGHIMRRECLEYLITTRKFEAMRCRGAQRDREREREGERERERERERGREREREREGGRGRDRQTETDRQKDRQTDIEIERDRERQRDKETGRTIKNSTSSKELRGLGIMEAELNTKKVASLLSVTKNPRTKKPMIANVVGQDRYLNDNDRIIGIYCKAAILLY